MQIQQKFAFFCLYVKMDIWLNGNCLMQQIQSPNIAELLMQMHFMPAGKRRKQMAEAEKLLEIIDKNKEYPYEFVCFRITGFVPKTSTIKEIINGGQLAEDLRIFIAKLSGQIAEPVITQKEKIYTVEDLAGNLRVSTKTINRWRKRGLVAKKFIFEGGQKKFAITQSSLDKFVGANPTLFKKQHRFKRLTDDERKLIIKNAARFSKKGRLSRHQIIKQIAQKTGRSRETIRYTLIRFEKAHPDRPIGKGRGITGTEHAAEIYRQYKEGHKVKEMIGKFGRSKSTIYRLIKIKRTRAMLAQKIEYVFSDEFVQAKAEEKILGTKIEYKGHFLPDFEGANVAEYTKHLIDAPTLTRQSEMEMFRRYNFLKYLANTKRVSTKSAEISAEQLDIIENYMKEAQLIKKIIIEANLRFIIAIAQTLQGPGHSFRPDKRGNLFADENN